MREAARHILTLAEAQGFALAGIAPARPSDHADAVRRWVDEGRHGTMAWLEANLEMRLDPRELVPGARSVIAVADAYAPGRGAEVEKSGAECRKSESQREAEPLRGRLARYAWGDDYHKVLKGRLHALADELRDLYPEEVFRPTVDTAPALEREHAARAGLGWQAKNTMMIHRRHGSYTLLGLIVTTLDLAELAPAPNSKTAAPETFPGLPGLPGVPGVPGVGVGATDHCANCTRCIDACPTGAIAPQGYAIDASRCVSYLTLEHRGVVPAELQPGIGDWLGGCDICQEVCPYNAIGARNPLPVHERYAVETRRFDEGLDPLDVVRWTVEDRARVFRGSALKRIKLDMVRRNALIVLGNALAEHHNDEQLAAVRACVEDESDLVRTTARQVLERLAVSR